MFTAESTLMGIISEHRFTSDVVCRVCKRSDCSICSHAECVMSCLSCCRACCRLLIDCDCSSPESPSLEASRIHSKESQRILCSHDQSIMDCLNCCRRCWNRYQACVCLARLAKATCIKCRQDTCYRCDHFRCVTRCQICRQPCDRESPLNCYNFF